MRELVDTIRRLVAVEIQRYFVAQGPGKRYGNVTAWDPKKHAAKVTIQPEGIVSNWIPVSSEFIGNGWGLVAALSVGDQVEIHWPEGGINQASITRRVFDNRNPPPQAAQQAKSGEYYLVDKAGSVLAMTVDGKLSIAGKVELDLSGPTIKINATTEVDVTAPTINATATSTATVRAPSVVVSNGGATQAVKLADGSNSTVLKAQ
jgi:phage baseplate assembly protein gpV